MIKRSLVYYIKFYFYSYIFFIQSVFAVNKKKDAIVDSISSENKINLFDEEVAVMQKPSQTEAMANKIMFGLSQIPKGQKKKIISGVVLIIYFIFSGITISVYLFIKSIIKYPAIGWVFMIAVLSYFCYAIYKSIHMYFKQKKYTPVLFKIGNTWSASKEKANKTLNKIYN